MKIIDADRAKKLLDTVVPCDSECQSLQSFTGDVKELCEAERFLVMLVGTIVVVVVIVVSIVVVLVVVEVVIVVVVVICL